MADITTYSLVTIPSYPNVPDIVVTRQGTLRTTGSIPVAAVLPTTVSIRTGLPYTLGDSVFTAGSTTLRKLRGWNTNTSSYSY